MAGASDIRAGGAYVEIGGDNRNLKRALGEARKMTADFGREVRAFGLKTAALGGIMTAPLAMAAKQFANYGEEIGKLRSKTGMSVKTLVGLKYAAESSGLSMQSVSSAIKTAMKNGYKPEQFEALVDSIAAIPDQGERAAKATEIFGRAGIDILPILEGGSAEMRRMADEAEILGLVLGEEAAKNALKLDEAFDRLRGSVTGLSLHIGAALEPALTPVINRLIDVVTAARLWIDVNPKLVEVWANIAAGVSAAGAALAGFGALIVAALSPMFLLVASLALIIGGLMMASDQAGKTKIGFGEMFNSIRIDGTGLATWWGVLTDLMGNLWTKVMSKIHDAFQWGMNKIFKGMWILAEGIDAVFNLIIKGYNKMVGLVGGSPIKFRFTNGDIFKIAGDNPYKGDKRHEVEKRDLYLGNQHIQKQFDADPQDQNAGAFGFRGDLLLKGFETMGKGVMDMLANLLSGIPPVKFPVKPDGGGAGGGAGGGHAIPPSMTAVGTFSGYGGANMVGTGVLHILNEQVAEAKKTNIFLSVIAQNPGGVMF